MPYKNLQDLFAQVEPLQKKIEARGNKGLDAPALNETRNATWHLICALNSREGSKEHSEQIQKAERHAQRAIYDCREALLLLALNQFKTFNEYYSAIPVSKVIHDYSNIKANAKRAIALIDRARAENGGKREAFYSSIEQPLTEIELANELCESSRDDLNRYIEEENEKRRTEVRNRKVIAITIVIAFLTLLAALLAVPQFNDVVFNKVDEQKPANKPKISNS